MNSTASSLDTLNPHQRQAVEHGIVEGRATMASPLLIIAGAGSGKTNTLAHRVAHLIAHGADPHRILLMTFSRRAAAEMSQRVQRICRKTLGDGAGHHLLPWAGTFHGIGARLLRHHAEQIGLNPDFTIHDARDSEDLMNLVRHELGFSKTHERFPKKATCRAIYSRVINTEAPIEEAVKRFFPRCAGLEGDLKKLFAAYVEAKQVQNVLDYDDLLLYWAQAMTDPLLAAEFGGRFDYVMVDEYQDTNRLQSSILLGLKPQGHGMTVVGDDAQSIYSFRAATVRNILDFPDQFQPAASIITLDQNYRSNQPILNAANAVIEQASERFTKTLWSDRISAERPYLVTVRDEADQAHYVANQVLAYREEGLDLKQQAVLFRTAHHSGPLEVELTRRNIPFKKFGGLRFLDAAHVKDMLATLRFVQNPRDKISAFRVLLLLPGIGPRSANDIINTMTDAPDPLATISTLSPPQRTGEAWDHFTALLRDLKPGAIGWPAEIELVRDWYQPYLERTYEDAIVRNDDLLQLVQIASGYPSRERFLTELTLDPPDATSDQAGIPHLDDDYLILSTIHSAKGQEWKSVFILNTVDGCIPSDLSTGTKTEIDEERRVLYVAMTRAKDHLHLVMPQRFFTHNQHPRGDRHVYTPRTRFIPSKLLKLFSCTNWSSEAAETAPPTTRAPQVDVAARMRKMWA